MIRVWFGDESVVEFRKGNLNVVYVSGLRQVLFRRLELWVLTHEAISLFADLQMFIVKCLG
jgi:hypothetical protein